MEGKGSGLMPDAVEVHAAERRFGTVQALQHASFSLEPGTWTGLVGPNGAGKTTLMRALCGLERLDGGTIRVLGGEARASLSASDRQQVGLVPQEIALYPLLTPRENLQIFGRLNGLRGRLLTDRVDWALAWTGLEVRADDRVHTLSGGMKRCLNIACTVLHRPRIVLLDEPTVGVDVAGRERIRAMLRNLRADGAALLQSSHQLDELQAVCDRILILYRGRLLASLRADALALAGLGGARTAHVTLDRDASSLDLGDDFQVRGRVVEGTVHDVSRDLTILLRRLAERGYGVHTVRVEAPRLEEIFDRLTGWRQRA
jgi:ABC-2 type transport system ATP-binding protein